MLFGKQDKESDDANQILSAFMGEVKKNFKKVDNMLLKSIKPLQDRVAKLEDGSERMSDLLKDALSKLNSIDPQSVVALRLRLTTLELDFQNQAETIRDDMKVVKDDLRGELEQTMNHKIETTEKRNEENIANVVDTVGSTCKNLIEESEANLLKVVKDDFIGELEQNIKHKIETTEKSIEENLLSKIDDVQTNLEVAQHGYLNDIKKVQENNDKLKSCSNFADTKIKRVKDEFEEFKTVDWIVFKREISGTVWHCRTKLDNLTKTQADVFNAKEDFADKVRILNKELEQFKDINQRLETMSKSISRLEDKTVINKLKCLYCTRKMGGLIGMNRHMQTVHPEIPFIPHPEHTQETGTIKNNIQNKDSVPWNASARTYNNKFNSPRHDNGSLFQSYINNAPPATQNISVLGPIENALKQKLSLMNQ